MKILGAFILSFAASNALAWAGGRVEERRPAAPDGIVKIENASGSIKVVGWDREEIEVTGTLGRGAEGLAFEVHGRRARIEVDTRGNPHGVHSELEIRVPARSRLDVESFSAPISVSAVKGHVKAESVNGSITVAGGSEADVSTVNGEVEVSCPCTRVRAETVNGGVTIRGASGDVEASTVNGTLVVEGGSFERAQLETVNGGIRFQGDLDAKATLDIESVGGSVELVLPAKVSADFTLSTFSGDIVNDLGPAAHRTSRWTSEKELSFSTGSGAAKVTVTTLSGDIRLRKR